MQWDINLDINREQNNDGDAMFITDILKLQSGFILELQTPGPDLAISSLSLIYIIGHRRIDAAAVELRTDYE